MTKIVITAGHSNTDPGAVNGNTTEAGNHNSYAQYRCVLLKRSGH